MEVFICHFLKNTDIREFFKFCIPNPIRGKSYALIFYSDTPQFYFINFPLDDNTELTPKGNRVLLGLFNESDFDNNNKINALKLLWQC